MTRPKIDPTISLGNVLTIGTLVFLAGIGWARLESSLSLVEERFALYDADAQDRETRIRVLEFDATRSNERQVAMLSTLIRIEARLEEIAP